MNIRLLALLLTVIAANVSAQTGTSRPISPRPAVGDLAPDIMFTKVLSVSNGPSWLPSNVFGKLTVPAFFPDTSDNLQTAISWNALIDRFVGKPVQFVWITAEKESSLVPWLAEHPLKGFVLLDPDGATSRAYGIELPVAVIIGTDGRIVGFDREFIPGGETLKAALEGRITIGPLEPGTAEFMAFVASGNVLLDARAPQRSHAGSHRPDFPPSYNLHINPSQIVGTGDYGADDFWSLQGFDVKGAISRLYDLDRVRIELPASFEESDRYDFSMVLPKPEPRVQMKERFRQGIQDYFHLVASRESRLIDMYVVTAPDRKLPAVQAQRDEGGEIFGSWIGFKPLNVEDDSTPKINVPRTFSIGEIDGITLEGTVDQFCETLERQLDRPVVNETNLQGKFKFDVKASQPGKNDFLDRLREQLGLVITPGERNVEMLVFNPR